MFFHIKLERLLEQTRKAGGVKTERVFPGLSVLRKKKKNGSTVPGKMEVLSLEK